MKDPVLVYSKVEPTAYVILAETSRATFFYINFFFKSVRTSVKSSCLICLSPAMSLSFPTHFERNFDSFSGGISSSLSKMLSSTLLVFFSS